MGCINSFSWIKPLPLAFDDSLTYYEQICNLAYNLDSLKSWVTEQINALETPGREYTDVKINTLRQEIEAEFQQMENYFNKQIQSINNNFVALQNSTNSAISNIEDSVQAVYTEMDFRFTQFESYIKEYINSQLIEVKVINYFTGESVTIQQMFDYLALFHVNDGIIYDSIPQRNKTVDEIIALDSTVSELILHANSLIV